MSVTNRRRSQSIPSLSPTPRTTLRRLSERAQLDRAALEDVLRSALICHLGLNVDGVPLVLPTVFAFDLDPLDESGTLYVHGSVAARSLLSAPEQEVCVTVTALDGIVLARSGFHHSMNYRSAVVLGRPRVVDDEDEKLRALDLVVDHLVPGRAHTLRPHTRKELAATSVLALSLAEASVKVRAGDPVDDDSDLHVGGWAGVLPLRLTGADARTAADAAGHPVPEEVRRRAAALR